jgi:hypothetical protein
MTQMLASTLGHLGEVAASRRGLIARFPDLRVSLFDLHPFLLYNNIGQL